MRTETIQGKGRRTRQTEAGFTLVEFMTSTAVIVVMLGMAFSLLDQGQSAFRAQNASALAQARARKAINLMVSEIVLAGAAPVTISPSGGAAPGVLTANSTAVRVVADRDASGTTNGTGAGGDGDINDDVTYSFSGGTIFRTAPNDPDYQSGGAAVARPVIDGVSGFTLTYFDANGNQLGEPVSPAAVRAVRITIVTSVTELGRQTGTVTVEGNAALRNMQLDLY